MHSFVPPNSGFLCILNVNLIDAVSLYYFNSFTTSWVWAAELHNHKVTKKYEL